jgi:cytidylate kinase
MRKINIAIDGHSSCGKSTLAKALAKKLGYIFIDTGAMYRAVTYYCFTHQLVGDEFINIPEIIHHLPQIELHFEMNEESQKLEITLNGENVEKFIRTMQVSRLVSKIAAIKEVRLKLVAEQQKIGQNGGVVMDGRDIGSVVFPNAELKLFVTASPEVRATRRFLELNDPSISYDEVLSNIVERDRIDSSRAESPLIQTSDAVLVDNSDMSKEEQFDFVMQLIHEKFNF